MKIGDALAKSGQRAQALENYRKSLEVLELLSLTIPAHAGMRGMLAEAYFRVGRVYLAMGLDRRSIRSKRIEHLRDARSAYQRAANIVGEMRKTGIVSPNVVDMFGASAEKASTEIAKCDTALQINGVQSFEK